MNEEGNKMSILFNEVLDMMIYSWRVLSPCSPFFVSFFFIARFVRYNQQQAQEICNFVFFFFHFWIFNPFAPRSLMLSRCCCCCWFFCCTSFNGKQAHRQWHCRIWSYIRLTTITIEMWHLNEWICVRWTTTKKKQTGGSQQQIESSEENRARIGTLSRKRMIRNCWRANNDLEIVSESVNI